MFTPDSMVWIDNLESGRAIDAMLAGITMSLMRHMLYLGAVTGAHAPRFSGDMVRYRALTGIPGATKYEFGKRIVHTRSESPADSIDPASAPFNVAWGKQDGFESHRVAFAVSSTSGAPTRGRLRRKLAAWAAAFKNPGYAAVERAGDADEALKIMREKGLPSAIRVTGRPTHWAWDDDLADTLARRVAYGVWGNVAREWER